MEAGEDVGESEEEDEDEDGLVFEAEGGIPTVDVSLTLPEQLITCPHLFVCSIYFYLFLLYLFIPDQSQLGH